MIQLEHVTKRYGSKTIIHDISFDVKKGEIVGFLGPNGAGKTTTMRMIAGFTTASTGSVRVAGYDMATENNEAAKKIGYLPEQPPLYDVLDVSSYLRFVARAKGISSARIASELDRVMQACRLETVTTKEIYKLSKGYRQRVGLAQALLGDPDVLLLDEPTAGLDPGQIQETREVTLICQRIAIINHGRILAVGSPQSLQRAAEETSSVVAEVSGEENKIHHALNGVEGITSISIKPLAARPGMLGIECQVNADEHIEARIARAIIQSGELHKLERRQPTLENIFLRYIGHAGADATITETAGVNS